MNRLQVQFLRKQEETLMLLEDEASGRQANLCLRIPVHPHRTGGSGHNAVLKCVAVATKS